MAKKTRWLPRLMHFDPKTEQKLAAGSPEWGLISPAASSSGIWMSGIQMLTVFIWNMN
jgi:hypothetical protein